MESVLWLVWRQNGGIEHMFLCKYQKKKTNHKKPFYSYRSSLATNIPLIDGIHVKRKSNRVQCMKSVH